MLDPAGYAQERSEWAPVVTSLPVRARTRERDRGMVSPAGSFHGMAGGPGHAARFPALGRSAVRAFTLEELASAGQWLRAASAALHPAPDAGPARAEDTGASGCHPCSVPPPQQPLGPAESVDELCGGIAISASRLRAAVYRGRDQAAGRPRLTSGGWQWTAQAAAVTSHLGELALRSLQTRAAQLPGVTVTQARLRARLRP